MQERFYLGFSSRVDGAQVQGLGLGFRAKDFRGGGFRP